jgi:hypothetical protein
LSLIIFETNALFSPYSLIIFETRQKKKNLTGGGRLSADGRAFVEIASDFNGESTMNATRKLRSPEVMKSPNAEEKKLINSCMSTYLIQPVKTAVNMIFPF